MSDDDIRTLSAALAYIKHVGANHTMLGKPHPQQQIVDGLERMLKSPAPEARYTESVDWLEGELVAILDTVAPRGEENSFDYAVMVSSIRRIFEMDQDRYIDLTKRVRARSEQLRRHIAASLPQSRSSE